MKRAITIILLALTCIMGYAQCIDPALEREMGRRNDDEKIDVFIIMKQQYDREQLCRRADYYTTRAARREFVVNELRQFAEASQYDLRRTLVELQRGGMVSEPKVLWLANAICFEATRGAILSLANRTDILVIGFDEERNWLPDGEEAIPAPPTREIASNVTQVNANQVWELGYTGQGVVVAVIDTGVNYNHIDLADHLWDGGTEFPHHGYDVYNDDNNPMDDQGHGTHCAGTVCGDGMAGSQTGIAPDATLMCVKCLGSDGTGSDSQVIGGMQWAVSHGCDIMSLSLGGHGHSSAERTLYRDACVNVLNAGVIAAIAAGNEGNKMTSYPIPNNVRLPGGCPPPYLDPDQLQNAGGLSCSVCVGAVNSNDVAASFSSKGPFTWTDSDYADYPYTVGSQSEFGLIRPDVCAPGVNIKSANYTTNRGYTIKDGTSMATPCVAGCMALLLSKNYEATPAELCCVLEKTAVPRSIGKSNVYGCGRVDALAAINALYVGPLTLDSYSIDDATGNNDGKLNPGESVGLDFTLVNGETMAVDGVTIVLSTESEYVTLTDNTAALPHFDAGETKTIESIFTFSLSDEAPINDVISFTAEFFREDESLGNVYFSFMVYGTALNLIEITVVNDDNEDGFLAAGETGDLHVVIGNTGNEDALSVTGTLSSTCQYLTINGAVETFGDVMANGQASADFNVTLASNAPDSYAMEFSLDLVDASEEHTEAEFELWRKHITLGSNPVEGGVLSGEGYYGKGQTCTITATANEGYVFMYWTLNGTKVSYLSTYSFNIGDAAEYVANFMVVDNGILIGDAVSVNAYLPDFSSYPFSMSQQIYTADELGMEGCEISSVSFFNTGNNLINRNLSIYMVPTEKTEFENSFDWIPVSDGDLVFSGNVEISRYWVTIQFSTPFSYDGVSNLALLVDDNTGSYYLPPSCRTFNTEGNQALYMYSSYTNFDPYAPNVYSGFQPLMKNQVIFGVNEANMQQSTELAEGWNWFSLCIEADDPVEMIQLLEQGLGGNGVQIKSAESFTTYEDEEWFGDLDDEGLTNEQMYKILTTAACTVELEGLPAHPDTHEITINPGWNWIGFPCTEEVDVADAFAGFDAEEGDQLKSSTDFTSFEDGEWFGDVETLVPGQGYMYYSASDEVKTLVYQTGAKARR